ncbi:hypothetical protein GCM10009127_22410 [Alteraurantiacibacter aestuarii]|uniref:hypothetical protein n=1 Tax=Alteraurantiacibacter aestuarii TaxID=650004 RepID=UPI0031E35919
MVLCWLACAVMLALMAGWANKPAPRAPFDFSGADIAVIGGSLTMYGIPASDDGKVALLADGRSHVRVGLSDPLPEEIEDLVEQALDGKVQTILLEVRPFIFVLRNQQDRQLCNDLLCESLLGIRRLRNNFRDWYRGLLGRPSNYAMRLKRGTEFPIGLDEPFTVQEPLEQVYPVIFLEREPSQRMQDLVRRATEQETRIILYQPPRSPMAQAYLELGQNAEISNRSAYYARRLQLPLFDPDIEWSNDDFVDRAHLGASGRAKLVAALRQWWADTGMSAS